MPDAAVDLLSVISPADFGGLEGAASCASPGQRPTMNVLARRTASGARAPPSTPGAASHTGTARRVQARRSGTLTRRRSGSKTSGSSREERTVSRPREARARGPSPRRSRAKAGPSPTRERIRRARAAAESSRGRSGKPVSIMDVVLNAQERLDADDLLDAVEQCQRVACGRPSAEDDVLADMLVPGRYEARQAAFWRELAAAAQIDYSPKSIYHVSAERSTAMWDGSLAGDEPI